ncbi:MAG: sugar phosphate isomerase/epimerase [Lachnospiraceae bacterium]|nr:sugar phosphate isomerase/epimerase [Lachnospiraceae bacterium]
MRLGGTVAGRFTNPQEWEEILVRTGFRAVTAPFSAYTPRKMVDDYCAVAEKHDVLIAEVGVWKNIFDPDPKAAAEAMAYAKAQLALADELGIECCVNIAGTAGSAGWDGADPSNYMRETYDRIVASVREILDAVQPKRAWYCLEPMPWMVPDGPDEYLQLIRDVDRPRFGAHMDFVNMINSPRRYLCANEFIGECFAKLGPYIRSTHLKDSHMDRMKLTTVLTECSPGEGELDFRAILKIIDRYLPADAPVLLEHMNTFDEYRAAYDAVAAAAASAGVGI